MGFCGILGTGVGMGAGAPVHRGGGAGAGVGDGCAGGVEAETERDLRTRLLVCSIFTAYCSPPNQLQLSSPREQGSRNWFDSRYIPVQSSLPPILDRVPVMVLMQSAHQPNPGD